MTIFAVVFDLWREGLKDGTKRSYRHDLEGFARFVSAAIGSTSPLTIEAALLYFFGLHGGSAHDMAGGFRASLVASTLAPASINRALATLRSVSKFARKHGQVPGGWCLDVPGIKAERRWHSRAPDNENINRLLAATAGDSEIETRDYAMVSVMCLGVGVAQVCALDISDLDLVNERLWLAPIRRGARAPVNLSSNKPGVPRAVAALARYLAHRGAIGQGPLFVSRSRRRARDGSSRLHSRSVLRIVDSLGRRVGLRVSCRHLCTRGITNSKALSVEQGDEASLRWRSRRTTSELLTYPHDSRCADDAR